MTAAEPLLSPIVISKALRDVAHVEIDSSSDEGLRLAASHVSNLMTDAVKSAQFLDALEFYGAADQATEPNSIAATAETLNFGPLRKKAVGAVPQEDDMREDVPTQGRMSRINASLQSLNSIVRATKVSCWKDYEAYLDSFRDLGLDEALSVVVPDWYQSDVRSLRIFISSTLKNIPPQQRTLLQKLRSYFRTQATARFETYLCYSTVNAGFVELKHGEIVSQLVYLLAGKSFFINVKFNDRVTLHSKTSVDNPETFSSEIVDAFDGNSEYAAVVLESIRHVFDRHSIENPKQARTTADAT